MKDSGDFYAGSKWQNSVKRSRLITLSDLSQKNEQSAWSTYQDQLYVQGRRKLATEKDPAYQAYIQAHHATSQTMEKVAIPEKPKKDSRGKKRRPMSDSKPKSFGDKLKDFMSANPHFIRSFDYSKNAQ